MAESVLRGAFPLHYHDADAAGFLRLTSLLNQLQSLATNHFEQLGGDFLGSRDQGLLWVMARFTVTIEDWPRWPGSVEVETWLRGSKALLVFRDFQFGSAGQWNGKATAAWVLLKDRRPQRPEPWLEGIPVARPVEPAAELPAALPPIDVAETAEHRAAPLMRSTHAVHADWEDIDLYGHVNNVSAIGWCLSLHDEAFLRQWRPSRLEANFLAEMFCGEKYVVLREDLHPRGETPECDYLVYRDADQTPTLRLRIQYKPS